MTAAEHARLTALHHRLKVWISNDDQDPIRVIYETAQELAEWLASVRVDPPITLVVEAGSSRSEE